MKIELCWNITSDCNQKCKYCHRFLNINKLSREENFKILDNIINSGIDNITFTGGEALLINYLEELMEKSHINNIHTKLITNGLLLTEKRIELLKNNIDLITLSLDSNINTDNEILGRGIDHFNRINNAIRNINKNKIKFSINTVVTRVNMFNIYKFSEYIQKVKPIEWRIFKFMPLRETARKNQMVFDVGIREFNNLIENLESKYPSINIVVRNLKEMETLYLLILANGDIVITQNGKDIVLGNALKDDLRLIIKRISCQKLDK